MLGKGIHILLVIQKVILTFFYQPTHLPQKIFNVEHRKLFRNTNPSNIGYNENIMFLECKG